MRVCVYAGSNPGDDPGYVAAAKALGRSLAQSGHVLVYGGGKTGLMGAVADAALAVGGEVVGVMPAFLAEKEIAHRGLTRLDVVATMHERKARMAELADAFVALPGGAGTLEEIFEAWTWGQLGRHAKPCALLNACGYYDKLADFLDHVRDQRFMKPEHRGMLIVAPTAEAALDAFAGYAPPQVGKWIAEKVAEEA